MTDRFLSVESGNKVRVVFFDYQIKEIPAPDDRLGQREEAIAASFEGPYVLQAHRILPNLYSVIAAEEALIKNIYASLSPRKVEVLIPYGMAIRAFCTQQELGLGKLLVFVDEVQPRVLVTIIEGLNFSETRSIDPDQLSVEIKRTVQNYCLQHPYAQDKEIQVVSCKDLNVDSPALAGLQAAQFAMHFNLPQDMIKQKRQKSWGERIKGFVLVVLCPMVGAVVMGAAWEYRQYHQDAYKYTQQAHEEALNQLKATQVNKLMAVLKSQPHAKYAVYYHEFLRHMPRDYFIKTLSFQRNPAMQWGVEGVIAPMDGVTPQRKFRRDGIFAQAKSTVVEVDKGLGEKISLWRLGEESLGGS